MKKLSVWRCLRHRGDGAWCHSQLVPVALLLVLIGCSPTQNHTVEAGAAMQPGTTAGSVPTISSTSMPEPESTSTSSTKPTIQPSTPRSLTDTSLGWRAPSTTTSSTIPATATTVVEVQIPPEYLAPGRPPPAPVVLPPATQLPGGAWDGHLTGVDMSPRTYRPMSSPPRRL